MQPVLTMLHFFPEHLNLYGDRGNVTVLQKRCGWRNILLKIKEIRHAREACFPEADLFMIGGGSDREQGLVMEELVQMKEPWKEAIEDGLCGLAICGGYQLLGQYYELADGTRIQGLGILDYYSRCGDPRRRLVGNLGVISPRFGPLVGFENHGGETFHAYEALGDVVFGYGNNLSKKKEGLVYKHVIGTYLHGPVLSKNPVLADWMIMAALRRKYGEAPLPSLNNELEDEAKKILWNREAGHRLRLS